MPAKTTPGQRVRAARQAAGLTQTVLAGRLGCSQQYIVRVEGDKVRPTLDWLLAASKAIGCLPSSLAVELADPKPDQ
jgi:transcriptional regulator with XRE-family HTH domain